MNNEKNILIKIENLKKVYTGLNPLTVLNNINLNVYTNEILAITGESGSGKTTLLNLIGGIDNITSGHISIDDKKIENMNENNLAVFRNKSVGYVFQFHNLLGEFSAIENVMIPSLILKYDKGEAYKKSEYLLEAVGLKERINHRIGELSGGEAQRVAIARALINNPLVILADEPTGNLDKKNASVVQEILWEMTRKIKSTLIVVTHSRVIAEASDRKFKLESGETLSEY